MLFCHYEILEFAGDPCRRGKLNIFLSFRAIRARRFSYFNTIMRLETYTVCTVQII